MLLKQYSLGCFAHASYLIADEETGTEPLTTRPDLVRCMERVTPAGFPSHLASPTLPFVLAVRTIGERQDKHIDGSLHIPLNRLKRQCHYVPLDRQAPP